MNLNPPSVIGRSSQRSDDSINGPVIATVDRDGSLSDGQNLISFYLKTVLRDEEQVRDSSSNSLCVELQFACRLFHSVLDSFPLQLNARNQTLIEGEGRNHILNSNFRLRQFGMKSLASGD